MRFGIIGAGRIGKIHGGNVAARPDSEVAFVADADPAAAAALAKATGAKVADIDAILASKDVDAVAICSPTDTHADLIERAARAGKAIFCEKPIDLDVDRVRACLEVVKQTGATLMVGFNRRFDPNFAALRKRVAEGAIGALEIVSITSRDPAPPPISYIARSGGLFRDMMIHDFDMARFVLGEEPVAVSAMGSALVDKAIGEAGDIDTAVVIMETASGKVAQISNSRRATYGYDQRVEAHGVNGMLQAANVRETTVEWAGAHGFTSDKALNFFLERYEAAYRNELDAFIGAVKAGQKASPGRRRRPQGAPARGRGLPVLEDQAAGRGRLTLFAAAPLAPRAAWPYRRRRQREEGMAQAQKRRPALNWAPIEAPPPKPPTFVDRLIDAIRRHRSALRRLGVAASVIIIAVSLTIFLHTLVRIDPNKFKAAIAGTSGDQIMLSFAFTALSYLALTGYDGLALRHLGHQDSLPADGAGVLHQLCAFRSRSAFRW